jgi:hypothetical protein
MLEYWVLKSEWVDKQYDFIDKNDHGTKKYK